MSVIPGIKIKQIILLLLIILTGVLLVWQLYILVPGILGAITLYILLQRPYRMLIRRYRFKPMLASILLILVSFTVLVLPIFMVVELLLPKLNYVFNHSGELVEGLKAMQRQVQGWLPENLRSTVNIDQAINSISARLPGFLGATANLLTNIIVAFFVLYFLLVGGDKYESMLIDWLPLQSQSIEMLSRETRNMIFSNAIGIPVLAFIQGSISIGGYWMFGVKEPMIWGIVTGMFSMVPVIGTAAIWIPLSVYLISTGAVYQGIGLLLFCTFFLSVIDNVLRFTLLKRFGNVPVLTTVFGVIVGVKLFGFMGLIFGPLLIAYFLLLLRMYKIEFGDVHTIIKEDDDYK